MSDTLTAYVNSLEIVQTQTGPSRRLSLTKLAQNLGSVPTDTSELVFWAQKAGAGRSVDLFGEMAGDDWSWDDDDLVTIQDRSVASVARGSRAWMDAHYAGLA